MAQTRRRRRRRHRGTQSGSIERRGRGPRPRSRQEARARARQRLDTRRQGPPTWSGAVGRALIGAAVFFLLLVALLGRPAGSALALAAVMAVIYIPMGYYIERFFWRRRLARSARGER